MCRGLLRTCGGSEPPCSTKKALKMWVGVKAWEKLFNKASLWSCAILNIKLCLVCENQAAPQQGGPQQKAPLVPGCRDQKLCAFVCLFRHAVLIQLSSVSASRVPLEPQGAEKSIGTATPALLQPHAPSAQSAADLNDLKSVICQLPPLTGISVSSISSLC